jgi:arginyl-tRNA--protein-N-Asp/Glu arginylyltransferase
VAEAKVCEWDMIAELLAAGWHKCDVCHQWYESKPGECLHVRAAYEALKLNRAQRRIAAKDKTTATFVVEVPKDKAEEAARMFKDAGFRVRR